MYRPFFFYSKILPTFLLYMAVVLDLFSTTETPLLMLSLSPWREHVFLCNRCVSVPGLQGKLQLNTQSLLTKFLHSFYLCPPASKINSRGRLTWSFQKLFSCPRLCNSKCARRGSGLSPSISIFWCSWQQGDLSLLFSWVAPIAMPCSFPSRVKPAYFANLCLKVLHCYPP